jgi:hypothetical protein
VQVLQPSSPCARPTCVLPSCSAPRSTGRRVADVVPAVAMAVASTHARTHLHSRPCTCAPTHMHACTREGGRPDPFIPLSLDRSRARRRSAAASRGAALRGTLPPGWRECRVVPELARPFSCLHTRTVAGRGYPAALPSRSASVRRDTAHPRARSPPVSAPVPLSMRVHPCTPRGCEPTVGAQPRLR